MRILSFALLLVLGSVILWASQDLPQRGDPEAPAATHDSVSVYYIEHAYEDALTPNMVTSVLADYRGYDTFGEAVVVVAAAIAALLILLRRREDDVEEDGTHAGADGGREGGST